MRMRSHRRNLVEWSEAAAPAGKSGDQRITRFGRIRWWLRTGALLTFIGVMRLARIMRVRWRAAFLLSGALLIVIGVVLPSLAAFLFGPLVVLLAMPKGTAAGDDGCWIPFVGRWPPSLSDSSRQSARRFEPVQNSVSRPVRPAQGRARDLSG